MCRHTSVHCVSADLLKMLGVEVNSFGGLSTYFAPKNINTHRIFREVFLWFIQSYKVQFDWHLKLPRDRKMLRNFKRLYVDDCLIFSNPRFLTFLKFRNVVFFMFSQMRNETDTVSILWKYTIYLEFRISLAIQKILRIF